MSVLDVRIEHRVGAFALDVRFQALGEGVTALFGPSGAGKTSVIKAIAGLITPDRGRICVGDVVLLDTAHKINVPVHKRRVGCVLQNPRLFPHLSVRDNCLYGARRAGPARDDALDRVSDLLELGALLPRYPEMLSGGERQRVAIARALLCAPRLLLLDEPLSYLDAARKAEVLPHLERLSADTDVPILYVSHAVEEVTRLAKHLVVLSHGRVEAAGALGDVMARGDLFPLHGHIDAGAVIDIEVVAHVDNDTMTQARFAGGDLWLPKQAAAPGSRLRLRIPARDVILAREVPTQISANNVLRGTVADIRAASGLYVDVRVDCAGTPLLARITPRSVERLQLEVGGEIYAIVKSMNL